MNEYEGLIYSLICNCNREVTTEEKQILNQASAIYNTYNKLSEQIGCPLDILFKALKNGFYDEYGDLYKVGEFCLGCDWFLSDPSDKYLIFSLSDKYSYLEFKIADYKKAWWLREDKSE